MERNRTVDVIKGISILFVLITHFNWTESERLLFIFPFFINMAIPAFMIVSGWTYSMSYERNGIISLEDAYKMERLIGKIMRYTIPFLFIIVWEIFDPNISITGEPLKIIKWLTNGASGPGSYYYPLLIQLIFIFPVLAVIFSKRGGAGLALCFFINATYEFLRWSYDMNPECYRLLLFRYIFAVAAGIYAYRQHRMRTLQGLTMMMAGLLYLLGIFYFGFEPPIFDYWKNTNLYATFFYCPYNNMDTTKK